MNKFEKINSIKSTLMNDKNLELLEVTSDNLYSCVHILQLGNNVNSKKSVRVAIDLIAKNTFHKKVMKVKITDDNNPFFIYALELSDDDYGHLKMMQGLLIDFCNFPNELILLLNKCKSQLETNMRFFITLEENSNTMKDEMVLKIMETNCLKVLCHLALTLTPVCIGDVQNEVLAKIAHLKGIIQQYDSNQKESERRTQELEKYIEQKNREYEELRNHWDEQQKSWGISLSKQLNEVREEYLKKHNDVELEVKQKEEEMKLLHNRVVEQLNESLETIKIENSHLIKLNLDLDEQVRSKSNKINNIEKKIDNLTEDLQTSTFTLKEKIKECEMKETTIKTLKTRLGNTDKQLVESTKNQVALERLIDELRKEKTKLLSSLKLKEQTILDNNDHLKTVCGDLVKANSIIKQLQKDNNLYKMKLDKALQYFQEQTTKLVKCTEQLHAMKEASEAKKKELDYLQKTAMSTNDTLKELKKDLLSTKQMTRLHDIEIMDLKRQPVKSDYKINGGFRKHCLENVYLRNYTASSRDESSEVKHNRTSGESVENVIHNSDLTIPNSNIASGMKTSSESINHANPKTHGIQTHSLLPSQQNGAETKPPNIPLVDIADDTNLPDPVNKPQKNSHNVNAKVVTKPLGICRATNNKISGGKLPTYFQKTKLNSK